MVSRWMFPKCLSRSKINRKFDEDAYIFPVLSVSSRPRISSGVRSFNKLTSSLMPSAELHPMRRSRQSWPCCRPSDRGSVPDGPTSGCTFPTDRTGRQTLGRCRRELVNHLLVWEVCVAWTSFDPAFLSTLISAMICLISLSFSGGRSLRKSRVSVGSDTPKRSANSHIVTPLPRR